MDLQVVRVDLATRVPTVVLNTADAAELGVNPLERVQIDGDSRTTIGIVEVTEELVSPGSLGATGRLGHLSGTVTVSLAPVPASVRFIRKKLDGVELERDELRRIVADIYEDRLSDIELSAYVTAAYTRGLSFEETRHLSAAMADVGARLTWPDEVVADKHSIGGVIGNRVTPIVVPIVVAAGVTVPKTSSRAITSPAGTADTMEVFCDVEFSLAEVREIVAEAGGCMVWGGGVNLSPVDDRIIRAENPLSLDPRGQLIASVLSKKRAAGSTHVLIDIPYGEGAKVESLPEARELATDFKRVGAHLDLRVECAITRGDRPIGRGIGPVLEARDVLTVLSGGGPTDLRHKSLRLAGMLLECCGVEADPAALLDSGAALAAFHRIVAAQGGDPEVALGDLRPGEETWALRAARSGVVSHIDNALVGEVARRAGAPKDARAGVHLGVAVDDEVERGEPLFLVHAEHAGKLADARALAERTFPVHVRDAGETLVERL
jgi:AMP phosphorylase